MAGFWTNFNFLGSFDKIDERGDYRNYSILLNAGRRYLDSLVV